VTGPTVTRDELLALVDEQHAEVRSFLTWAQEVERRALEVGKPHWSLRLQNRQDIAHAAEAATLFPERWWGIVVCTAFGSTIGAKAVATAFPHPLAPEEAWAALEGINFPRRSVGHHRIQPGVKGAKRALVAACEDHDLLHRVLHDTGQTFEARYSAIRDARLPQWGRTTAFDLLLRAGALGVGGETYGPTIAHLAGSTGPRRGFEKVWGRAVTPENADWCEELLHAWTVHWHEVAERVEIEWNVGDAYTSGDFENALCIWQERRHDAPAD
jgi:hypothetical protein